MGSRTTRSATRTTVRRATPADARAIAEVTVASWQAAYHGILPAPFLAALSVEARQKAWHEMLSRDEGGRTPAWVAEDSGSVGGFIGCGPPRDADVLAPAGEVYAIYVRPERWRSGLGRSLLDAATTYFQTAGARAMVLWVLEANARARAFYEAMGWHPDGGRREFEMGGAGTTELRYRRGLA
jgi:ribosomal protein S18 acetylase RimI-like enzyme